MVFQTTPPREIDTNALVHAQREELEKHDAAQALIRRLSDGDTPWAIPVFCISEFPRVVTNRRFFRPPTTLDVALDTINVLLESLSVQLLAPVIGIGQSSGTSCTGPTCRETWYTTLRL